MAHRYVWSSELTRRLEQAAVTAKFAGRLADLVAENEALMKKGHSAFG